MDSKELIKKVRKVEIRSGRISNHLFSGEYHSAFKGKGMSFSEVREYVPGDEIRDIDWNVTARTGTPHVKIFEEERELTVMLLIDISNSTQFGSQGMYRRDLILELAAVLAFSANSNNDKVGLILFTDKIELFITPKKGRKHSLRLIREIIHTQPTSQATNVAVALDYLNKVLKKKAICFLISDFLDLNFESQLKPASRRHDLIALWCTDPLEEELPDAGLLVFEDAETGQKKWVDTSDPQVRKTYKINASLRQTNIKALFRKNKAGIIVIPPNDGYQKQLLSFFNQRARV